MLISSQLTDEPSTSAVVVSTLSLEQEAALVCVNQQQQIAVHELMVKNIERQQSLRQAHVGAQPKNIPSVGCGLEEEVLAVHA